MAAHTTLSDKTEQEVEASCTGLWWFRLHCRFGKLHCVALHADVSVSEKRKISLDCGAAVGLSHDADAMRYV